MLPRLALGQLRRDLQRFPVVALVGPRQVGKTTLALALADELGDAAVYVDLELPSDRAKLADPELYFSAHEGRLLILDEIHRTPDIFQTLRSVVDRRRRKGMRAGQFLLLGSASIDLLKQSAETLAGRITYLELAPFSVPEVGASLRLASARSRRADPTAIDRLWIRGGFPDSFLAEDDEASLQWRRAFIQTYLERDLPALGPRVPAETIGRFWQMLAHEQGQLLHAARLASGLGVSGQTVARYLDTLVDLLLVRRLVPMTKNPRKRLIRSPKVYVRDSGIAHALLGIATSEQLLGHPVVGPSWEGFVIENVLLAVPGATAGSFYRTSAGAEIDLLLDLPPKRRWALEIKRSISHPEPSRGFHIACDDVEASRRIVVYPGEEQFRIDAKTEVMPLPRLLEEVGRLG